MYSKKFKQIALLSTMLMSIGAVSVLTNSTEADAKTVISQTDNESIILFSKEDLKQATGIELSLNTVDNMHSALKQDQTWTKLGYSSSDAKKITQRFSLSDYQAKGILSDIVGSGNLELKVVIVNKTFYSNVNIGTERTSNVVIPEDNNTGSETGTTTPETNTPEVTTPEASILEGIKEIEIDIEYKKKDIELDLDVKSNGRIKAEVENEFTNQKIKDDAAKAIILDVISGLDVKNSSEETIKNHVISKLNAGSDFKKFKFKVKYFDGSKVEFKLK